jgi:hypothetical protein
MTRETITMPPATGRISFFDALLRPHRRSQRKADM